MLKSVVIPVLAALSLASCVHGYAGLDVDDGYYYRGGRHYEERHDHYDDRHYDHDDRGHGNGRFCPPGQAKKGNC